MTIKSTSLAAALLGGLLLPAVAMPGGAFAQTETPVAGAPVAPKPKPPAHKPASLTDRVEQHITQLRAQLGITPAQQPQWDQFAAVMRDNAKAMSQTMEQRGARFAAMNASENMQSYAQIAQQHAQDVQKLATAFQPVYESMSDDQKKLADAVFRADAARPRHMKH
jgi:protein CpxP